MVTKSSNPEDMMTAMETIIMPAWSCLKDKTPAVRAAAERTMLHLLQLYACSMTDASTAVLEALGPRLKEADFATLKDYAERTISKGADAIAVSDDDEDAPEE